MSASNERVRECDTVHHITSRVAHKVFLLSEDERNDLVGIIRRAAAFCGLRLLGWCVMTNHFHLLVHLPLRVEVSDEEVLRRVGILKGAAGRSEAERQLAVWKSIGDEARIASWYERQRARMYDVGEYMKTVKQWFTEDYNQRQSHIGTLWESVYHDTPVPLLTKDMANVLGYIHLNPMRALLCSRFTDYRWSSLAALANGDAEALEGMRFVYDAPEASADELMATHVELLDKLLDGVKRQRAEEIARRRAAGYEMPVDALTDEALVAQAAARLETIRRAAEELKVTENSGRKNQRERGERAVMDVIRLHPTLSVEAIASAAEMAVPTVYKHLRTLKTKGTVTKQKGQWIIV